MTGNEWTEKEEKTLHDFLWALRPKALDKIARVEYHIDPKKIGKEMLNRKGKSLRMMKVKTASLISNMEPESAFGPVKLKSLTELNQKIVHITKVQKNRQK